MPQTHPNITPELREWALEQPLFYVASAPLRGRHVNLSPKGVPSATFSILDETHAAYLDFTASGAETIAHIYENGRVTVMFCSFGPKPRILRLYCTGSVVEFNSSIFLPTVASMGLESVTGVRAVVKLDVWKVVTSCGFAVPIFDANPSDPEKSAGFQDRHVLEQSLKYKAENNKLDSYRSVWNVRSHDGLPAVRAARKYNGEWLWLGDTHAWLAAKFDHAAAILLGMVLGVLLTLLVPVLLRLNSKGVIQYY